MLTELLQTGIRITPLSGHWPVLLLGHPTQERGFMAAPSGIKAQESGFPRAERTEKLKPEDCLLWKAGGAERSSLCQLSSSGSTKLQAFKSKTCPRRSLRSPPKVTPKHPRGPAKINASPGASSLPVTLQPHGAITFPTLPTPLRGSQPAVAPRAQDINPTGWQTHQAATGRAFTALGHISGARLPARLACLPADTHQLGAGVNQHWAEKRLREPVPFSLSTPSAHHWHKHS